MASTAKQYSYTNASAWIQSTDISASHSGTNVTISGTLTMWTAGSSQTSSGVIRYVWININGTNYYTGNSRGGPYNKNTTYTIPYSYTINVGHYNAGSLTVGFYVSASSTGISDSGTLIWNGRTSTSTSDCSLKTTAVGYGSSWTNASAPTSVSFASGVSSGYALKGASIRVKWSGATNGTGNPVASYTVLRNGSAIGTTTNGYLDTTVPGTGTYTYTVRANATYNSPVSSASASVTGYTNVSGPTSVTGGTQGYVKAGASFNLGWSGAANGTNNAITAYTVNGTNVGKITSKAYTAPAAGASKAYTVKAIGTRNTTQYGSASRTIYGVSINQVAALNVSPATIIDTVTLSWAHPTINSAATSGLARQYTLQFSLNNTSWTNIATGITGTSYVWEPTTAQVPYGSSVYFRIIPYVYYSTTQITDGAALATSSFLRGELPNKIKKVIIQNTNNIGTPATRIFDNIDTTLTVSGSLARLQNGIKLTITPGAKKSGYIRGIAGRWSRYGPTGTSSSVISTGTIAFTQVPGETESVAGSGDIVVTIPADAAIYNAADNDVIQFEIWAVNRISGNDIPSETVDLTTNATNVSAHFRWNAMPYLRTSPGPFVSQGPSTIAPVNFNDNIGPAAVNVTQILGQDETTIDFTNCAYKLYCRDITTNPSSTYVSVLSSTYKLFGAGGTYSGDMFIPTDGSADQTLTLPIIGAGSAFLEAVLGDPLSAVNRLVKLQYKITTVDSLLREGTSGVYEFQLQYDFRTVPVMESAPTLYSSSSYPAERSIPALNGPYTCIPLVNGFGSESGDAIVFEWQPAYDANNKASYSESGTHRIDYSTGIDPIKEYRLYRYSLQNGVFAYKADTKLIAGTDYFPVNDGGYLKYRGRYNINLTNANKDEIIFLKIVPVASNDKTNVNDINTKLDKNFYCTRLSTPLVVLNTAERDSATPTKAVLTLALSDNGGSKSLDTITINTANWASYNNLSELKLSRTVVGVSAAVDVSYTGSSIPFSLPNGTEIAGLNIIPPTESLDARLGYQIAVTSTIRYTRITTTVVDNQISMTFNTNKTLTSIQSLLYVPPAFGTLALRKNKVAINKSDLEEIEEALTVVGKDRVEGEQSYYKNIVGIHNNANSKMPAFDGTTLEENIPVQNKGSYIGFYTSDIEGATTWQGSLGFEEDGLPYMVARTGESGDSPLYTKKVIGSGGIPDGGLTGQILKKASDADQDTEWGSMPIVQTTGQDTTKVMSQKAVTDAIGSGGGALVEAEFIGCIKLCPTDTLPSGYLWCDGTSYPANGDYAALYEVVGTTYNEAGDAAGTFRVPDLRGRVTVGKNTGTFDALGKTGGEETHILKTSELPAHVHTYPVNSPGSGAQYGPSDTVSQTNNVKSNTNAAGGGEAHNNLQPYLVCNYIIKYSKSYENIGITAPPVIWDFAVSDWQEQEGGGYVLSIPESEHRRGQHCVLTALYDTTEAGKLKAVLFEMEKNETGDIWVYSDSAFVGKAYIDRVYMIPAGRVLTVNGQTPDVDGDVVVVETENANKLGGLDPKFYKSAILKFKGGASSLPTGTAYGLMCKEEMVNTAGISYTWDNRDFVIPDGYNYVRWWGGFCGVGGTTSSVINFGWVKCDPTINGAASSVGIPNASALTFCNANNLGITHTCYTPIAEAYVTPGDKIGFSVYCAQNSFWMYSKLFCIELMNV
jgi:microcystin-dependent protein